MAVPIPESHREILTGKNFAHLATLMRDGSPQVTPVWVDFDGTNVLVNAVAGRVKVRNMDRDPRVALSVLECGKPDTPDEDRKFLILLMADEEYQRNRRRRLPDSITGGHTVYACDLGISPDYLPFRKINEEMPVIPCLAEPGDSGQIRIVPYWCAFGVTPPAWAEECKVAIF